MHAQMLRTGALANPEILSPTHSSLARNKNNHIFCKDPPNGSKLVSPQTKSRGSPTNVLSEKSYQKVER